MILRVIVVGAGGVGAAIALRLARWGMAVTVIDAGGPATGASGASFGWINASFHLNEAHFALRHEGIAAHHRLAQDLGQPVARWPGALWWEETGAAMAAVAGRLRAYGYPVAHLSQAEVAAREPALANPPGEALQFPAEGAVDLPDLVAACLAAAQADGARLICGLRVTALVAGDRGVAVVVTEAGAMTADHVVLAAGTGTPALLAPLGLRLPMPDRPGMILRCAPVAPFLRHILVAPAQEVRQDAAGRLLVPAATAHQTDEATRLPDVPQRLAEAAWARVRTLLPSAPPTWAEALVGWRPVPADGLPVVGQAAVGLWLAVMHSGATLAPLVAELLAAEIAGGAPAALLASFRPGRFG
jgi:glycine/D-amino acid oxidase-like deaminating enzyme